MRSVLTHVSGYASSTASRHDEFFMFRALVLLPLLALAAAVGGGCTSFRDCSTVDASAAEGLPELLSETGLYSDIAAGVIADDAIAFVPRYRLWTDSATKRRWLILPEGGQVDTEVRDDWSYPVGTKFFKDFTRDGVLAETRISLLTDDGWTAVSYVWNEAGDDAVRQLETVEDVAGTAHDVPGAAECLACHGGRRSFALGFSATQLEPQTRSMLFDQGVLSHRVEGDVDLDPVVREGLGVLHANCSHCHNATRAEQPLATTCYSPNAEDVFDLSLPSDLDSLEDAPAMLTARFELGDADGSRILSRMRARNLDEEEPSMPPLGTELVDDDGVAAVEAFIATLPPTQRNAR
jgi:hypothetical protein